jgi:hypothetical protein
LKNLAEARHENLVEVLSPGFLNANNFIQKAKAGIKGSYAILLSTKGKLNTVLCILQVTK